jgi:hypothetical protein
MLEEDYVDKQCIKKNPAREHPDEVSQLGRTAGSRSPSRISKKLTFRK